MQPRGRASDPNLSTFDILFDEKTSKKRTCRFLNLGQNFQIRALLMLISLGYLFQCAGVCGPRCVFKSQKIKSTANYERQV